MAQTLSTGFNKPTPMTNDGCAVFINDVLPVTANPTTSDTLDFKIPKGVEVSVLHVYVPVALAASGLAGSWGFAPITGSTVVANGASVSANPTYFKAAAAFGQAAAKTSFDFVPITFEDDVYLRFTPTVTATGFAAGSIYSMIGGNMKGVK